MDFVNIYIYVLVLVPRFQRVQTHALLCLNNLVSTLDTEALGGVPKLHTIWQGLSQLAASIAGKDMSVITFLHFCTCKTIISDLIV